MTFVGEESFQFLYLRIGNLYHLRWALRSGVFSLVQFVPTLHQFNNYRPAEVHQLETRHISPAMHEPLQRYVLKPLGERKKERWKERLKYGTTQAPRAKYLVSLEGQRSPD